MKLFNCADLTKVRTIVSVDDYYPYPEIVTGKFCHQYYAIRHNEDLLLEDNDSMTVETGIKICVPEGYELIVHRAHPENGCDVEPEYFFASDGEIELKIKIYNFNMHDVIVHKETPFAIMFLKEMEEGSGD